MFMYTDYTQHLLDNVKKIHFIGCGGSGMYPLIQILSAKGYDISGSDVLDGSIIRSEREMGVKVTLGHSADNVVGADLVVYSAAISKDNVELNAAASYGITTVERSVLLGYVSRLYKQSICVSGTHGKTTTTSMITTALELAGRDPSAVIGGKLPLIHGYGKAGKGDDIVIEACEFSDDLPEADSLPLRCAEHRQRPSGLLRQHGRAEVCLQALCPDDPVHDLRQRRRQEHDGRHVHS